MLVSGPINSFPEPLSDLLLTQASWTVIGARGSKTHNNIAGSSYRTARRQCVWNDTLRDIEEREVWSLLLENVDA